MTCVHALQVLFMQLTMKLWFIAELKLNKRGVRCLDISHSTPGHQTVKVSGTLNMKVSGTLFMELYRFAQYEGIERTDLFSHFLSLIFCITGYIAVTA